MANYAIPMERRLIVVAGRAAMAKNIFEKLLSIHGRQALDTPCASEKPELMKSKSMCRCHGRAHFKCRRTGRRSKLSQIRVAIEAFQVE